MQALRLTWWEVALLIPFGLVALLLILAGELLAALVLVAVLVVVSASRATIVERNRLPTTTPPQGGRRGLVPCPRASSGQGDNRRANRALLKPPFKPSEAAD